MENLETNEAWTILNYSFFLLFVGFKLFIISSFLQINKRLSMLIAAVHASPLLYYCEKWIPLKLFDRKMVKWVSSVGWIDTHEHTRKQRGVNENPNILLDCNIYVIWTSINGTVRHGGMVFEHIYTYTVVFNLHVWLRLDNIWFMDNILFFAFCW